MIVDCHTHAGTDELRNALVGQLSGTIDAAFVLAGPEGDRAANNQQLSQFVSSQPALIGWAIIDPTEDPVSPEDLQATTLDLGLRGVVLYCSRHAYNPTHSQAMKLYEAAQSLGVPVFFHNAGMGTGDSGDLAYAQPYLLDEVAQAFPELKMVIGCMGVPFYSQTMAVLMRHEHVFSGLTICPHKVWQTYNIVMNAYEHGVMNKLLFGSGFPEGDAGACIEALLGFNMRLADTSLPTVPRGSIRNIVERDSLNLLGIQTGGEGSVRDDTPPTAETEDTPPAESPS
jgi:predicted TIM-barrel fold metal-dependent hydrolase